MRRLTSRNARKTPPTVEQTKAARLAIEREAALKLLRTTPASLVPTSQVLDLYLVRVEALR